MLTRYRAELALAVAVLAFNLLFLGHLGLFNLDEAIYAEATREMVEQHDPITPHYNYEFRWKKPPLVYWAMLPGVKLCGPTAFGSRLASAAQSAFLVLLLALFGRAVFGGAAGLWAGAIFGTCLHGCFVSRMSLTDMPLVLWLAAAWMALFLADERGSPRWTWAAGAALGLAVLTKGPLALVLVGLTWLLYALWQRGLWQAVGRMQLWWGFVAMALVAAPWYVAIYRLHGLAFYREFIGYHNVARMTKTLEGHGGPLWLYLPIVIGGLMPWTGLALGGLVQAIRRRTEQSTEARAALYLVCWVLCVFVPFSVAKTKLFNYIGPIYPALALLGGWLLDRLVSGEALSVRGRRVVGLLNTGVPLLLGAALAAAPAWLPRIGTIRRELGLTAMPLGPGPAVAGSLLIVGALWAAVVWHQGRTRSVALGLISLAVGGFWAIWLGVAPVIYHYQQGAVRVMAIEATRIAGPHGEVGLLNLHWPTVVTEVGRKVAYYTGAEPTEAGQQPATNLAARFAQPEPAVLIVRKLREAQLLEGVPCFQWADCLGYRLVANVPPPPGYELPPIPWTEDDVALIHESQRMLRRSQVNPSPER